jgi:C-terminal processing protease CtpA/Prc
VIRPAAHRFAGKLVVLINGGSFSSTAIVAAILEREKRAVFAGEETGGNKTIISGDPAEVLLPYTTITSYISTVIYRIGMGVNNGHGVMPDYRVQSSIGDRLTHRDRALEFALGLIRRD